MKNYLQPGYTITLIAPYAVAFGDSLLVTSILASPQWPAAGFVDSGLS